jgi:hypothetical protein
MARTEHQRLAEERGATSNQPPFSPVEIIDMLIGLSIANP